MTTYTITPSADLDVTEFDAFTAAREAADAATATHGTEFKVVTYFDGEPVLAYQTTPVVGRHFQPWERVENVPTGWTPPAIEGYTLAYTRKRIQTGVYRPDNKADNWLIVNQHGRIEAANTKEACGVTKRLGQVARGL